MGGCPSGNPEDCAWSAMSASRSGRGSRDQLAEQAAALGPVIDRGDLGLVQADRDELGQPAVLADHAQRTVPRVHQRDRGLHDAAEHGLELEVAAHRDNRLKQAMHPVAGRDHRLQPALKLGQQVIKPQLRQDRMRLGGFHGGRPPPAASGCDDQMVWQ